jgi:C-terminal processing protease CtpA/Prc
VAPGSSAEKAGLRQGDIIIAIDGRPIVSAGQLRARVGLIPVGQSIELDVLRDGNRVKLNARIVTTTSSNRTKQCQGCSDGDDVQQLRLDPHQWSEACNMMVMAARSEASLLHART